MCKAVKPLADEALGRALFGRRVLFVLGGLERGGAETQALLLADELRARFGARVGFLGLGPGRVVARKCEELGIPVFSMTFRAHAGRVTRLLDYLRAARAIGQRRPEIVASYTIIPNVVACSVRSLTGRPFCVWNQRDDGCARLGRKIEQYASRRAAIFVANSSSGACFLRDELRVPSSKVAVVRNGVRLAVPRRRGDEWRRVLGVGEEDCVATMIANIHSPKDHATLLYAFRSASAAIEGAGARPLLVLAGRADEDAAPLRGLATELVPDGRVLFVGEVDDVAGLLEASDLAVLSSRREGLPNAALEAMIAGLPVVGTDLPGMREALGAQAEDCLAPPGDAESLAEVLAAFFSSREKRVSWGARNRLRAETEFSVDRMVHAMATIFAHGLVGR